MHLWSQAGSTTGNSAAQNPAGEAQHSQQAQWQLQGPDPARQPAVLSPAHTPGYRTHPAQHSPAAGAPALSSAGPQPWLGEGRNGVAAGAVTSPFLGSPSFPAGAGQAGALTAAHTAAEPNQHQQQQHGTSGTQPGSLAGLIGPPASRAVPCPMVHTTPAAAGAAAAAAAAGHAGEQGSSIGFAGSLSMEAGMLDLPEPESMSWRPGGRLSWQQQGARWGVESDRERGLRLGI